MFVIYGLIVEGVIVYVGYCLKRRYDRRMKEHKNRLTVETADFESVILFDDIPTLSEALEMEKVFIDVHSTFDNGYNKTRGSGWGMTSEVARENNLKRVADGTHPFLGGEISRENNNRRVEDGTHPWLCGEIQRDTQRRRIADGIHPFLDKRFST